MYWDVVVGVLSFLVAILIGWQVWSVIFLERRIKRVLKDETKKIKEDVDKKIALATGTALFNLSEAMQESGLLNHAITGYIKSLCELYKENPHSEEVNLCFDRLEQIANDNKEKRLLLPDYALKRYISMLDDVKDERKIDLLSFLLK